MEEKKTYFSIKATKYSGINTHHILSFLTSWLILSAIYLKLQVTSGMFFYTDADILSDDKLR